MMLRQETIVLPAIYWHRPAVNPLTPVGRLDAESAKTRVVTCAVAEGAPLQFDHIIEDTPHRRSVLKDLLEHAVPATLQDVVIIFVTVSGRKNGELIQETYANKIYGRDLDGRTLSAIQITTAAAMCTVLDLLSAGVLPQHGFIRQEDISLNAFLESRFGQAYAKPGPDRIHSACIV
jgi:hypothetical protein